MRETCPLCHERVEFFFDERSGHRRLAYGLDGKTGALWAWIECRPEKAEPLRAWYSEKLNQLRAEWRMRNKETGEVGGPAGEVKAR